MYNGFDLSKKVAVLTGSTAGMGFAIARGLAQCGAKVVVSSNTQEDTDEGARKLCAEGFEAKGVRCDITRRTDVASFGDQVRDAFGRADILFCLAAPPAPIGPTVELADSEFDGMLVSTVTNNLALMRHFLPDMARRNDGSIVVMSSIASIRANPMLGGYGATKAALNSLVRSIAIEWGAHNIRANAIAPAIVRTGFSRSLWSDAQTEAKYAAKSPANRIAEPADIVGTAILLASPAGAYINGQTIVIDGGRSIV
jgi:dehydrogenase/reductase SDR family protein 4